MEEEGKGMRKMELKSESGEWWKTVTDEAYQL